MCAADFHINTRTVHNVIYTPLRFMRMRTSARDQTGMADTARESLAVKDGLTVESCTAPVDLQTNTARLVDSCNIAGWRHARR